MADVPAFDLFYAATHKGREPLPWQRRLAERVVSKGWPGEIGIPTGLGKTGCIDIAVWALAKLAGRPAEERPAPTRTWYVVNRRLLVDAAYEHALNLQAWLRTPEVLRSFWPEATDEHVAALETVGDELRSLAALGVRADRPGGSDDFRSEALHITRLRGGAELGARVPDPSQPALVFSTVPMFATRLLFRGYGSSRLMRSVDAALAGTDSLVLLDEAHLAEPLIRLAGPLAQCDVGDPVGSGLLPKERSRPRFVPLTATGDADGDRFDLDDDDLAHGLVQKRIHARKLTTLLLSTKKSLTTNMAEAAVSAVAESGRSSSCLVFANTPDRARAVFDVIQELLQKQELEADSVLLTGRMRERDAASAREEVLSGETGAPSGYDREKRRRHLLIVATQTLEVGADLDVDHLVTETAGVRAMVQRFGRLNRLGDLPGGGTAVIVHPEDETRRPVYGSEQTVVWERLQVEEAARGGESLDLGPTAIRHVLGDAAEPGKHTAELLPHHLATLARTSSDLTPYETRPEAFYDPIEQDHRVSVLWRAYLPDLRAGSASGGDARAVDETDVDEDLPVPEHRLIPPVAGDEAVDLPVDALRKALSGRVRPVYRLASDGASLESVWLEHLRPGDQVVLGADEGLYDRHGWNPASSETVSDLSSLRTGLILDLRVIRAMFQPQQREEESDAGPGAGNEAEDVLREIILDLRQPDDEDDRAKVELRHEEALTRLVAELSAWAAPEELSTEVAPAGPGRREADRQGAGFDEWVEWSRSWQDAINAKGRKCLTWLPDGTPLIEVPSRPRSMQRVSVRSDAFDELSFVDVATEVGDSQAELRIRSVEVDPGSPALADHLHTVGWAAAAIARQLGLPEDLILAVQEAGAAHDLGKYEERFQRWMAPEADDAEAPLAKSATPRSLWERTRQQSEWPRGGRHELLSGRALDAHLPLDHPHRDLVIHLAISHHGYGRPDVAVVADATPTRFTVPDCDRMVAGDLSIPDTEQPARFQGLCKTYGYWGLALLEAIVRQGDHAASARSEVT